MVLPRYKSQLGVLPLWPAGGHGGNDLNVRYRYLLKLYIQISRVRSLYGNVRSR
ncbi:hypothetical protein ACRALDRAFT_211846 [Sodiomyces alcalophilus JCM 7366]|uniref:uncharacterized protein n=1 Tax=Sodiomyces alcalophilus JCM 7366 TaxID=591952 RepID=UPI0039B6131D